MKVLIVDDQIYVYKAIQIQVNWESFGVEEFFYAANGEDAIEIIESEAPELVFTDMQMPQMDGPEFMKALREKGHTCEIIAISGYNDFEYVKAVIGASGVEYLLKPLDEEELNQAVKKAVEKIWNKQEKEENKVLLAEMRRERIGIWLNNSGQFTDEIQQTLRDIGVNDGNYRIALLLLSNPEKIIYDIYSGDAAAFHTELSRVAKDVFVKSTACHLIPANMYMYYFLVQTSVPDEQGYQDCMNRMVRIIRNLMMQNSIFVYSKRIDTVQNMPEMIKNMKGQLLTEKLYCGNGTIVSARKEKESLKIDYYEGRISGLSYLLRMSVRDKNLEGIGNIISEFCSGIRKKQYFSLYELQMYTTEINLLLRKIMMESREVDSLTVRQVSLWIYDLNVWEESVKNAFYEIASCHFGTTGNITAVYAYILENFGEDLSISALSARFNMSPQYLSKLFKNRYHKTIGQVITSIRMEKAQGYLKHGTATIGEIAHLTGFEDENYFGKVFKKNCGMSPQQFRKGVFEK